MIALIDTVLSLLLCLLPRLEHLLGSQGQSKLWHHWLDSFTESLNRLSKIGPSKIISFQLPCCGEEYLPPDQLF